MIELRITGLELRAQRGYLKNGMSRASLCLVLALCAPPSLPAQASSGPEDLTPVGPGVTAPRLLHKVEPEYSADARADHIQGTVVLQLVVNESGRPAGISVISPLGFGLDERAKEAVEKWEFAPGTKDGKPVKILAIAEVNFRFPNLWFDEKTERQRTRFNEAAQTLNRPDSSAKAVDRAVTSMQELAKQHFPSAMYVVGGWEATGDHVSKNPDDGLALIRDAAARKYGPALYDVATRQIEGRDLPKDVSKGLETMRQASLRGSARAQFYLGAIYEAGIGVPRDPDRARGYFRLCAAQGVPLCQYRLGSLLLDAPGRLERDYVQALAWFQLAAEQGIPEAKEIASRETAKLTPEQMVRMNTLKSQLVRK
jgi:TonB family protein